MHMTGKTQAGQSAAWWNGKGGLAMLGAETLGMLTEYSYFVLKTECLPRHTFQRKK